MTRGRHANLEPSVATNLHLPQSVRDRVDLMLFSELEGRVPKGAYQKFFLGLLGDFFTTRTVDLSRELDLPPGRGLVRAHPDAATALQARLQQSANQEMP